jgi:hypothetical protein
MWIVYGSATIRPEPATGRESCRISTEAVRIGLSWRLYPVGLSRASFIQGGLPLEPHGSEDKSSCEEHLMIAMGTDLRDHSARSSSNGGRPSVGHFARVLAILLLLTAFGCSGRNGEPPLSYGDGGPGSLARKTKLIGYGGGADVREATADYEVEYPNLGLKSLATVGLLHGSIREEVFPKKWRVIYGYKGTWEGHGWSEAYAIPLSIQIFAYSHGDYSRVVNTYRLSKIVPNYPVYADQTGKERTIIADYFQVAQGLH